MPFVFSIILFFPLCEGCYLSFSYNLDVGLLCIPIAVGFFAWLLLSLFFKLGFSGMKFLMRVKELVLWSLLGNALLIFRKSTRELFCFLLSEV